VSAAARCLGIHRPKPATKDHGNSAGDTGGNPIETGLIMFTLPSEAGEDVWFDVVQFAVIRSVLTGDSLEPKPSCQMSQSVRSDCRSSRCDGVPLTCPKLQNGAEDRCGKTSGVAAIHRGGAGNTNAGPRPASKTCVQRQPPAPAGFEFPARRRPDRFPATLPRPTPPDRTPSFPGARRAGRVRKDRESIPKPA